MSSKDHQTTRRVLDMLHGRARKLAKGDSLTPPIVNASKYALPGAPDHAFPYGRFDNPTWAAVESAIGVLEDAETVCFPSGMGAVTAALMAALEPGGKLLLPSDGYYTVRFLMDEFIAQHGIEVTQLETTSMDGHDMSPYDVVWLETPSNPGLEVCDIGAIAERVHEAGGLLIVDNTTATPLLQPVLDLGADLHAEVPEPLPALVRDAALAALPLLLQLEPFRGWGDLVPHQECNITF